MLGLSESDDVVTIHRAFRTLSKTLHPDTTDLPPEESVKKFQDVCKAYEVLSDPKQREVYDSQFLKSQTRKNPTYIYSPKDDNPLAQSVKIRDVRRPFSGGELFSLVLLVVVLLLSLLLGIVFSYSQGKELQVLPNWLTSDQLLQCVPISKFVYD